MPKGFSKKQKVIFFVIGIFILFIFLVFIGILPGRKDKGDVDINSGSEELELEFWGIDNEDVFNGSIESFKEQYPNVNVVYRQIDEDEYELEFIDSLASNRGPDILMIKSNWVRKHFEKLYPFTGFSLRELNDNFVDVIAEDVFFNNQVWGLPLWVDTLALYYNKDYFNTANLSLPPKTWQEFLDYSKTLTIKSSVGEIKRSGTSLGTVNNIKNAKDILLTLIIQSGLKIVGDDNKADFGSNLSSAGKNALSFYLGFSNPASSSYCWNENMPDSVEAFAQGKTAMMIGYSSDKEKIQRINPYLNYNISSLPQISDDPSSVSKNYANYWILSIPISSSSLDVSFAFTFHLLGEEVIENYLDATGKPPAERILVEKMISDEEIGIFASQSLMAKSWKDYDSRKSDEIFKNMIESVLRGRFSIEQALLRAANEIDAIGK
jgi:ABC-type glycerol-3-phosphate transport system substrate-binding protein